MIGNRKILATGATGQQRGEAIKALQASFEEFQILALARNESSSPARALASKPNITVVQGDHTTFASVVDQLKPIYCAFSITTLDKVAEDEQAKPWLSSRSRTMSNTSVHRGGEKSDTTPTNIPHFAIKGKNEEYLKEQFANVERMPYAKLRPVASMDNLERMGRRFTGMVAVSNQVKPL